MTYGSVDGVRALTGITTSEISDATLAILIAKADVLIDVEPGVSLTTAVKAEASDLLTASVCMRRLASESLKDDSGGGFTLDRLRVDGKSTQTLRNAMADKFEQMYDKLIATGTSASGLVKKIWDSELASL